MDDATSEFCSTFLLDEEGTASSFQGLAEMITGNGLLLVLAIARGCHFHTRVAGSKVSKSRLIQGGRALAKLRIEHISVYLAEARRRSEWAFRTLQDRLVKGLALAAIKTIETANRFVAEVYLPAHHTRFAVAPEEPGSAFVACRPEQWREILHRRHERTVADDNTVS